MAANASVGQSDSMGNGTLYSAKTPEVMNLLVSWGAELEVKNGAGRTPLLQVIYSERIRAAEGLLDVGAEVQAEDNRGRSALHFVSRIEGNMAALRLIERLLDRGADVNQRDRLGATPLDECASRPILADALVWAGGLHGEKLDKLREAELPEWDKEAS